MLALYFRTLPAFCCLLILIGFTACETDFDPNAPYQETTVIYGLIDPQDTVHYVKVNKAFLNTKTNAMTIAATEPDSSYHYDSITVTMLELRKGADSLVLHTFPMHPVRVNKEPGLFSYPDQIVYATEYAKFNEQSIIKIVVINNATKKATTASTALIPQFCIRQLGQFEPYPEAPFTSICDPGYSKNFAVEAERKIAMGFNLATNAELYKGVYKFNFTEFTGGQSFKKAVSIPVFSEEVITYSPNKAVVRKMDPFKLLDLIANAIDVSRDDTSTYRVAGNVDGYITASTHELYTYISVNNAFSAVTQTRPEYTNIKGGGTGLFTCRRQQVRRGFFPTPTIDTLIYFHPELKFRE